VREIHVDSIASTVRELCIEANVSLREDHLAALRSAVESERSPVGRQVLCRLLENAEVARTERVAFCQDTGYAVCFLELGQDVHLVGGDLRAAVDHGVREGYRDGYLRASIVESPIRRRNTGDNTPALLYLDLVPGQACRITLLIKGAGCDNMSDIRMLTPAQGTRAVVDFVVDTVERAGPSASPPVTVGVGVGGTFEKSALLAKRALTRTSGQPSPDPDLAALEREILDGINASGIGPAGFGGTVTALAVHVNGFPTHIAAFPVAVNIDCHSHRVREAEL
jgi:fumarate hydratase subunit alpha